MVTFSDDNGAITLGSFETDIRTGTNASESFQITADQFDTDRWDSDNDGVSNISESTAGTNPIEPINGDNGVIDVTLTPVDVSIEPVAIKTFRISWQSSADAQFYRVLENPDGVSGYSQVSAFLGSAGAVYLFERTGGVWRQQAYVKPKVLDNDAFGRVVSLSGDGETLAVGVSTEDSAATNVNGDHTDNSGIRTGAVFLY